MIVALELHPRKLWWDLFCSRECCKASHPLGHEDAEVFATLDEFAQTLKERANTDLPPHDLTGHKCWGCHKPLKP